MKSNDQSNEGSKRRRHHRPRHDEATFSRKEVRILEIISKEIAGLTWVTVVLYPDEILVRSEIQELAENLVWPATPYWELMPDADDSGLNELRVFPGEITPENEKAYEEMLVRNYDAQMQYQIELEARKKRKGNKSP